jgi:hypothetical protein
LPTILCFSTVDWDFLWHRPQAVMSRFAQEGYRVLYVDTLGLRSPKLRDLPRIVSRLRNRLRAKQDGLRQPAAGVHVVSPLILPFLNSRLARRFNIYRLIPQLQRQLERIGSDDLIIWVYLPTWTVLQCVERVPHRTLVYESIDALASSPAGLSLGYAEAEAEILRRADLVIATSESLHQEKGAHHGNAHWVPSGVAEGFFAPVEPAAEIAAIPGPRIGFFGTLDHRLDLEQMRRVARAHPEWSLVLIGPARCDVGELVAEEIDGVAIQGLVACMEGHPEVGLMAPRLVYPDGSLQLSVRRFPTLRAILLRALRLDGLFPGSVDRYLMRDWDHAEGRDVDWVMGACMLLRRKAVEEVGLLDEGFFVY